MKRNMKEKSNAHLIGTILGVKEECLKCYELRHIVESPLAIEGIGDKKAEKLYALSELLNRLLEMPYVDRDVIRSPHDVFEILKNMRYETKERFMILCLNTKNQVIAIPTISVGNLDSSLVHPREVFKEAMKYAVSSIILAHNHPSGDPTPSREDMQITSRLVKAGNILSIEVLDHIVIGDNKYVSLKEYGMM